MTESTMLALIPLPTVLPIVAAAITMVMGRHPRLQRLISLVSLQATFTVVIAVMAVAANPPIIVTALMSAWMPAPPPESDPARIKTRP